MGLVAAAPLQYQPRPPVARPFVSPAKVAALNRAFGGEQVRGFECGEFDICEEDLPDVGFSWPRCVLSWPRIIGRLITHRAGQIDRFIARLRAYNETLARLPHETVTTEELVRMATHTFSEAIKDCSLLYFWSGAVAIGVLRKACCDWLGDKDEGLGYRLLTAQGGMADVEAALDLWRLAALAHEDRETEATLSGDDAWDAISPRLAATNHGRQFLAAWDRFMAAHGHHGHSEIEFFSPRWSETPDYILGLVQGYLRSLDRANPLEKQRQLAEQRERLAEQCRRKLANPIKRRLFDWSLRQTGKLARDRENSKNEAVRLTAGYRRLFLELGERLRQQGILGDREDIFFLEAAEVEPVVQGRADFNIKERIAQRRAEYEWNMAQTPPPVVMGRYDPQKHAASKIDATIKVLKGLAVSPGVVTGKARVITHPDNGQHVEPGGSSLPRSQSRVDALLPTGCRRGHGHAASFAPPCPTPRWSSAPPPGSSRPARRSRRRRPQHRHHLR
jgi:pyruvate,water dikinase